MCVCVHRSRSLTGWLVGSFLRSWSRSNYIGSTVRTMACLSRCMSALVCARITHSPAQYCSSSDGARNGGGGGGINSSSGSNDDQSVYYTVRNPHSTVYERIVPIFDAKSPPSRARPHSFRGPSNLHTLVFSSSSGAALTR